MALLATEKDRLFRIYREEAEEILRQIDSFLSVFSVGAIFSFSENEKKQAEYRQGYHRLLSSLLACIEKSDAATLELTELLQKSDSVEQAEHIGELHEYFEVYRMYRDAILSYMNETEPYMTEDEDNLRLDRNLLQRKLLVLRQETLTFQSIFSKI